MEEILKFAHKSCHHGSQKLENNLLATIQVLNQYTNIDIIEIDFIFHNNEYISAHDVEQVKYGSKLVEWVDEIMKRDKILWLDLKDTQLSFFINSYSSLNVDILFNILNNLNKKYKFLTQHILIGCQYIHVYEQLIKQSKFTIIRDLPRDKIYVLDAITPNQYLTNLEDIVYNSIIEDCNNINNNINNINNIIAIDKKFFTKEGLINLLKNINSNIIIVYNFQQTDEIPFIHNKKIIYQYDY